MRGRLTIPYQCGARQRALLAYRKGEVDLMYGKGVFYLAVVCDVLEPEEMDIERVLGRGPRHRQSGRGLGWHGL